MSNERWENALGAPAIEKAKYSLEMPCRKGQRAALHLPTILLNLIAGGKVVTVPSVGFKHCSIRNLTNPGNL